MSADPKRFGFKEWNELQKQALDVVLGTQKNVVVVAPTGSGKSAVGYCAIDKAVQEGGRGFYLAPTRALCYEQYTTLRQMFENVLIANKDYPTTKERLEEEDVVVTTPFKLNQYLSSISLDGAVVVVDEVHNLSPEVEVILSRIKQKPGVRIIALSATLNEEDVNRLAKWLDAVVVNPSVKRPVPLYFNTVPVVLSVDENGTFFKTPVGSFEKQEEFVAEFVARLLRDDPEASVLVWAPTRAMCDLYARVVADRLPSIPLEKKPVPSSYSDEMLAYSMEHGVGIHHGGISQLNRELVHTLLLEKKLRVVITAYTLAQGVNLPARYLVITSLFETPEKLMDPSTFHQLAGRAGRPGLDPFGSVFVVVQTEAEKAYFEEVLLKTKATPLESKIAHDWFLMKMVMNLLFEKRTKDGVLSFFGSTYYAAVRGEEGVKELQEKAKAVMDELEKKGVFFEKDGRVVFSTREWFFASLLSMHPVEKEVALRLPALSYDDAVDEVLERVVKPQEKWRNFDRAKMDVKAFGLLTYYSSGYEAREAADLAQAFFDTATLFLSNTHGWKSEEAQAVRRLADEFSYGGREAMKEIRSILTHPEFKRFVRNFSSAFINGFSEELAKRAEEVVFGVYKRPNPERVRRFREAILKFRCYEMLTAPRSEGRGFYAH